MALQPKKSIFYLMSLAAGLIVANIYYSQPLLNEISNSFNVSESEVSNVALCSQLGYAFGLLLIIPLGDKIATKKILSYNFLFMITGLTAMAFSPSLFCLLLSSFVVGLASSVPQLLIPLAAHIATPEERGKSIGIVMSGLLIGILVSRIISGVIGEHFGWRILYIIAGISMLLLYTVLQYRLPSYNPDYKGNYVQLMNSLRFYLVDDNNIRMAGLRGALGFAGLSAFWTTLVFLMNDSFGYGSTITGLFGVIGIFGALSATVIGKWNDKLNQKTILLIASITLFSAWCVLSFSTHSVIMLIIGVILIDLGLQALHITNQNIIFEKYPDARNRVNTVYMFTSFIGGALGTTLGAFSYQNWGWTGVTTLGTFLMILLLTMNIKNYGS
ncbi:Predicted arabinose efflux permease, MFS family [Zhouia amylolytica]|uniref:Predicted arabinose efflux permease, MFS family n=2 Tax=Zhouia amylolytica TaxID=376730 RepID=A0A1I6VM32_9FLAO|nr:Predicted arabinose efflux permease, MFS family [Zhouia amylolytica]